MENPFHSLTDAEFRLVQAMIRDGVADGFELAMGKDCTRKCSRVQSVRKTNWLLLTSFLSIIGTYIITHL